MRADKFFAERFSSRTKASEVLKKGLILCGGRALSPSDEVSEDDEFSFLSEGEWFVSHGGYKLERALNCFGVSVKGLTFADLGSSTGGFCDCLLKHGAARVYCVDIGKSQLDSALASNARVKVMDGVNARYLTRADFPEPIDGVSADLSFISLRLILPAITDILPMNKYAFLLFKPQFECGRGGLGKGGICATKKHRELLSDFYDFSLEVGLSPINIVNAPIRERKNVEYMLLLRHGGAPLEKDKFLFKAAGLV